MSLGQRYCALCLSVLGLLAVLLPTTPALGQTPTLTPEQQRMLDSLPPAQRREAQRALRQFQSDDSPLDDSTSSISEELSLPPSAMERLIDPAEEYEEPRAQPRSRLVIQFQLPETDDDETVQEEIEEDPVLAQIAGSGHYELDGSGILYLPGLDEIPLLGLTAEQIELRLGAEPELAVFDIRASLLDTTAVGSEALEPFGYDVFESTEYGFASVTTGPVPADYILGPGDTVRVQLFGNVNDIYEFEVSRDGVLNLPELGPITVAGLPFSEFRADLNERVGQTLIGTQVSVTMGQLRTIRVFVLGDANRPGSYVVSSLETISGALYRSGGISPVGSLRSIELKRSGDTIAELDLYDLLLRGDTSDDSRLQPGDVIFIPPVGPQVSVSGAVRRPAIYEVDRNADVADVVGMAGGLAADAFADGARVERIDDSQERTVLAVDVDAPAAGDVDVQDGDVLVIPRVLPEFEDTVVLFGHVQRPGPYQWQPGMRLTDLLGSGLALKPGADRDYVLVRREDPRDGRIQVVSANLSSAFVAPRSEDNIALAPRDRLYVFDRAFGRQRIVAPILRELELQSQFGEPNAVVSIGGQVHAPGVYPLEPGMRVSDLVRAGGNLSEDAFALRAELVRYEVVDNEYRNTEVIDVDLGAALRGEASADVELSAHDNLRISGLPDWDSQWSVTLEGEVVFPGEYRIRRGETLAQILDRAGGLTDAAFADGAIFLRESLREREQEQIEILARRLESDITAMSLETLDTTGQEAIDTGRELLSQLRNTESVGRLVIDLQQALSNRRIDNVAASLELRDGDRLLVPKVAQEVTVIGETQQNTSHLYQPGLTRDDYIGMSGGLTRRADKQLIYVVRASGAVITARRSRWFGRAGSTAIRPGDTIVVPLETDRIRPLTFWTNVTQILYQAAIAVAAVQTFDN